MISYLKFFTWRTQPEVEALQQTLAEHPERREAQRVLAQDMTRMLHGETALARAEQASSVLFGGEIAGLSSADIQEIFADVPSSELARTSLEGTGLPVIDLLVSSGVAKSRGEARRSIDEGGISINNQRVTSADRTVTSNDVIDGRFLILRKGKKNYHLMQVI